MVNLAALPQMSTSHALLASAAANPLLIQQQQQQLLLQQQLLAAGLGCAAIDPKTFQLHGLAAAQGFLLLLLYHNNCFLKTLDFVLSQVFFRLFEILFDKFLIFEKRMDEERPRSSFV